MSIEESIFKGTLELEPDKMEDKILNIPQYIKKTGGGIYWILYWPLWIAFAQEVIRRQEKLDYAIIAVLTFFLIGIILSMAAFKHIQFIKRYRKNVGTWLEDKEREYQNKEKALKKEHEIINIEKNNVRGLLSNILNPLCQYN